MKHLLVRMDRPHLEGLPTVRLPEGYRLETARDGFEPTWAHVVNAAFLNEEHTAEKCREQFSSKKRFDPKGMFFVVTPEGEPVATAFAWRDTPEEQECGRVHWVATVPGQQGKGLGRAVTLAVLHYLKEHGFARAFLETQPYRLPAIRLYLSLGLQPTPKDAEHEECWREVMQEIRRLEEEGGGR
ncbi:MAG: GNAT family N-acetyltransferase [Armatimonadota bacterium]